MKSLIFLFFIPFLIFSQEKWNTNFNETLNQAQTENKYVLLVFSGSDWCLPCIRLKKEIMTHRDFISEINSSFLIVNADFPQKKKNKELQSPELIAQNKTLMETYNKNGYFPLVIILSPDKTVLGTLGYESITPKEYAEKIKMYIQK